MEADRLMMQMTQTSISLIGFGFTIYAFFSMADADRTARRLGLTLLCLGLVFLAMGIYNQAWLRLRIGARYRGLGEGDRKRRRYSGAPSFVLAIALLIAGLWALLSIIVGIVT